MTGHELLMRVTSQWKQWMLAGSGHEMFGLRQVFECLVRQNDAAASVSPRPAQSASFKNLCDVYPSGTFNERLSFQTNCCM